MFLHSKIKYRNVLPLIIAAGCLFFIASCSGNRTSNIFKEDYLNVDAFQNNLYQRLKPIDSTDSMLREKLLTDLDLNVTYAYQLSTYKPFWFDKSGLISAGYALPYQLKALSREGFDPEDYNLARIREIIRKAKNSRVGILDSVEAWDAEMTRSYLAAARDLLFGRQGTITGDSLWHIPNDKQFNGAEMLSAMMDTSNTFPTFDSFRPRIPVYHQMMQASSIWEDLNRDSIYLETKQHLVANKDSIFFRLLRKELGMSYKPFNPDSFSVLVSGYQRVHNLDVTGKVDKTTISSLKNAPDNYLQCLFLNMERLREMPRNFPEEYIWVNIPMMEMKYVKNGMVRFHTKVAVGSGKRKTPFLLAPMLNVIFNPDWTVPPVIVEHDIAEGIKKYGSNYLRKKNLQALNSDGKEVTASVNASNYKEFTYRQAPGPQNPLGRIKFNLPNPWDIYLHDTPHDNIFSRESRALSSGCIRLQDPEGLAQVLLHFSADQIDSLVNTETTQPVKLNRPLPVYIVYLTVDTDPKSGGLDYLNDIYHLDAQ
jgi:murein L,D-transpeptidase YcbB/YkuD